MSKAITKSVSVDAPPNIWRAWNLKTTIPDLTGIGNLNIYYQERGDTNSQRFFGGVVSNGDKFSTYAIERGTVWADGQVYFQITMNGVTYGFSGTYSPIGPNGLPYMGGALSIQAANGDGTWSATAEPPEKGEGHGHGRHNHGRGDSR